MYLLILLQLLLWGWLASLSLDFQHYHHPENRPIVAYVYWWFGAFLVYIFSSFLIQKRSFSWKIIVASGLVFRLLLIPSNPIQEDDFYRYLWDGASLSRGVNPYLFAPNEVIRTQDNESKEKVRQTLQDLEKSDTPIFKRSPDDLIRDLYGLGELASELRMDELHYDDDWNPENDPDKSAIPIVRRVNHPNYPTVYPPFAQGAFALAAHLKEGSLWTLRLVFVLVECVTLLLILKALKSLGLPRARIAWYAWNPLVIKEFVNSPHLDVLLVMCAAGFLCFWSSKGHLSAGFWAGLGIVAKLSTVIFLPFMVLWNRRSVFSVCLALGIAILSFSFFDSAGERRWQSMKIMGHGFRMNSVSLDILETPVSWYLQSQGKDAEDSVQTFQPFHLFDVEDTGADQLLWEVAARKVLVGLGVVWLLFWLWRSRHLRDPLHQVIRLGTVFLGLYLLSPVANPWYFGILMLFLPFQPRVSILALGLFIGLYYLRFHYIYNFDESLAKDYFATTVHWEWCGIFLGIVFEGYLFLRTRRAFSQSLS